MSKLFKGKKIVIMGLGLHGGGVGVAKFFCKQGAEVLITDLKTKKQLSDSIEKLEKLNIKYSLGGHKAEDFIKADMIIKNPDVPNSSPYLEIARKNNVPIETDINLFFKLSNVFIIGITGTKGKSTVASLIYRFLKTKYPRVFLAGNIGISPLELISKMKRGDKVVLELSSFELENLQDSPDIAVITNILPDHLNRYSNMAEYVKVKKIIFKYQKEEDVLILNKDDSFSKKFAEEAKSKVYFFSSSDAKKIKTNNSNFFGEHNLYNFSAATTVAKILKIPFKNIKKSIEAFKGVSGRQEFIKEINEVKYFNDTTATMPKASLVAINSFRQKFPDFQLILICGGQDKNLDYKEFVKEVNKKIDVLVILPGTASDKIKKELSNLKSKIPIVNTASMKEAVKEAKKRAIKKSIILLSPASASFNLFKNEFDRGSQFIKYINEKTY